MIAVVFKVQEKVNINILLFFGFLLLSMMSISIINHNINVNNIIAYSRFIFITVGLLSIKLNIKVITFFTYLFIALHVPLIITVRDTNTVLLGISRNGFTIHLLVVLALYYISLHQNGMKKNLLPALLGALIALWAGGRAGLLSLLFLVIVIVFSTKSEKKKTAVLLGIFMIISIIYLIINNQDLNTLFLSRIFQRGNLNYVEDTRMVILRQYFSALLNDPLYFFFGARLEEVPMIKYLGNNPHNSFINLHALFGLPFFICMITLLISALFRYLKRNKLYFGLLIFLLLRAFTDVPAFVGVFDPVIFYLVFNNEQNKIQKVGSS